jgi:predicted RNA-binding Zn-ribbon protein involved in translation (DUF1610 family)
MERRKYRQRGYMDSSRDGDRSEKKPPPKNDYFGPKTPMMPGKREVVRCASCATILPPGTDYTGRCPRCGLELHSCKQCAFFDTSARFECGQPVSARIPRKDARNECNFYAPRATIERETSTSKPLDARQAFENLFRK